MSQTKPEAFILTGAFCVICKHSRSLAELADRGLKILVITAAMWRDQALTCMKDIDHPASAIDDIVFVEGDLGVEGSFTAGTISAAQAWKQKYTIVGALAAGETLVEATGLLADALELPTPGLRATRACRSKYLQRWYLSEFSPSSVVVPAAERDSFDWSRVQFPAVVKPASRHSSAGVVTVRDSAELLDQVATYPPHEIILVEQRIVGQEFSVESLVQDEKVIFASVTRKETTESFDRTFVELAHSVPHSNSEEHDVLIGANQRMLELLAFENGIAHSEWRLDGEGRPYLMEVAARTPGDGLMALYQLAAGASLEPQIISVALGEPASYPALLRYTRQVYLDHEPGILDHVTVDWPDVQPKWLGDKNLWPQIPLGKLDDPPTLRAVLVLKDRGSELDSLRSSEDRAVTFFIDAASPQELDDLEQKVRGAVKIHTIGPAWLYRY